MFSNMGGLFNGCFLMVLSLSCVTADPLLCHYCSGTQCNDPFNITNAKTMDCSSPSTYRSFGNTGEWSDEEKLFRNTGNTGTTGIEYVCAKFVYTSDFANQVMTIRKCVAKYIDNAGVCDYFKKTVGTIGKVQSCYTCESNFCNSGITLTESFLTLLTLLGILKMMG